MQEVGEIDWWKKFEAWIYFTCAKIELRSLKSENLENNFLFYLLNKCVFFESGTKFNNECQGCFSSRETCLIKT